MNQIRSTLVPSALLAGICPLIANSIHTGPTDGAEILAEAAGPSAAEQVALALFLLGFAALVVALATVATAIARRTPTAAGVVAVAGAAAVAIKLSEAQTGIALRDGADVVPPGTAEVLVGRDEAGFVVYGFLLSLALGAAAVGLMRSGLVPTWLGWWGAVTGGLGVLSAAIGIVAPPHYVPIPFLLLLLWLVALGIVGARRPLTESTPDRVLAPTQ